MGATLHFINLLRISSPPAAPSSYTATTTTTKKQQQCRLHFPRRRPTKLPAVETDSSSSVPEAAAAAPEEPPCVEFAFVSPRLLPDGTPDVHYRVARGGQKLRDIMVDGHIDLYGPYDKVLLNCAGGGVCGTCIVEVVQGKELLSPKTEREKELLNKKPKTWRLACQATVGNPDSTGQMVIQQLPEWKIHEWKK